MHLLNTTKLIVIGWAQKNGWVAQVKGSVIITSLMLRYFGHFSMYFWNKSFLLLSPYVFASFFLMQCPPLNKITLGQHKSDNYINQIIQLTDEFCALFRYNGTCNIWIQWAANPLLSVTQLSCGHCSMNLFRIN